MVSTKERYEEFTSFHKVLRIIPTCQHFQNGRKRREEGLTQPIPDWKKCVLTELENHLPKVEKQKELRDDFFECQKSVYKQCLSVVEFSRNLAEIEEGVKGIAGDLFLLTDQHPRNGVINKISGFLLMSVKLMEFISWDSFVKRTQTKVMKTLDQILQELKNFKRDTTRLGENVEKLGKDAEKVFKHGPNADLGAMLDTAVRRENPQTTGNTEENGALPTVQELNFGLTHSNELIVAQGMIPIPKLIPQVQLALLIMLLQHIKQLLNGNCRQLKRVLEMSEKTKPPKKWSRIQSEHLTHFELALLRKSSGLLSKYSAELTRVTTNLENQSKFLYELRYPFKLLKENLKDTSYDPLLDNHFVMFQINLNEESLLRKYVSKDWLNENAANYIIQKFTEVKT